MYKFKDNILSKLNIEKIEYDIISKFIYDDTDMNKLKEIDFFAENILYIRYGKKSLFEILSYTKYKLNEYLVSFHYGMESFLYNKNSIGIMYSLLSLMKLRLYEEVEYIFEKNKENIIDIINSNKFDINEFIDILIYFNIPLTDIDDIGNKLEMLKNNQKKYLYILINMMSDKKNQIINNIENKKDKYEEFIVDIANILRELNLPSFEQIYKMMINNIDNKINYIDMLPCDNIEHHIGKKLLELGQIRKKSNLYFPKTISNYLFEDEFIKLISYKSKSLVSMHILKIKDEYIIIDCGAEIVNGEVNKIDVLDFFKENNINIDKIKGLIISHAHLDHYGSIDLIQPYINKIYMTKDTYNLINIVGKKNILDKNKVIIKKDNEEFFIDDFRINFISNNHIKGSIAITIEKEDRKILYTGDFSFNKQSTTKFIDEKEFYKFKDIDYLITETTYGSKDIDIPYTYKKKLFNYFINLSVNNNIKVIIPAFAIGRAQECYNLIKNSTINGSILVDGLAIKINEYYNTIDKNTNVDNFKYSKEICINDKYDNNDIIIASGGALNEGSLSEQYFNIALNDREMVTVLKCGYIDKETYDLKIKPYDGIDINFIDISLSAHASYKDLLKLISTVKPRNLIQVHGNGIMVYNEIFTSNKILKAIG